jgi:hypothetical protein
MDYVIKISSINLNYVFYQSLDWTINNKNIKYISHYSISCNKFVFCLMSNSKEKLKIKKTQLKFNFIRQNFQVSQLLVFLEYLKWYEICRVDFKFYDIPNTLVHCFNIHSSIIIAIFNLFIRSSISALYFRHFSTYDHQILNYKNQLSEILGFQYFNGVRL